MSSAFDQLCSSLLEETYKDAIKLEFLVIKESAAFSKIRKLFIEAVQIQDSSRNVYAVSNTGNIDTSDTHLQALADLVSAYLSTAGNQTALKVGDSSVAPDAWQTIANSIKQGDTTRGPLSLYQKLQATNPNIPPLNDIVTYARTVPIDWDIVWSKVLGNFNIKDYERYEALAKDWVTFSPQFSDAFKNSQFPGMPKGPNTPVASYSVWANRVKGGSDERMSLSADPTFDKWIASRVHQSGRANLQ